MNNDYRPDNENGGQTPGVNSDNQQYSYRSDNQNSGYTQNQNTGAQYGGYNAPGGGYGDRNRYYGQNQYGNQDQYGNQTGCGYQQNQYGYPGYVDESGLFSENKMKRLNGVSAKITIGDWMKMDCLGYLNLLLPPFGTIAYIIIMFVLAFSSKTSSSMKARVQANLVWSAIAVGLLVVTFIILIALGASISGAFGNIKGNY